MRIKILLHTLLLLLLLVMPAQAGQAKLDATNWYDGKTFYIDVIGPQAYSNVEILRIINVNANETLIVFSYNGFMIHLPFNRIVKMWEETKLTKSEPIIQ